MGRSLEDICIENVIKAFETMKPFETKGFGIHCEHDVLTVCGLDFEALAADEAAVARLDRLGFHLSEDPWDSGSDGEWGLISFRYGSA